MADVIFEKRLKVAIIVTAAFFFIEVAGSIISGSLSLLGDAGHMLRDVFALILSLGAISIARKLPTSTRTFGYHRVEIFAALINGLVLILISAILLIEAYQRFQTPQPVESGIMGVVAFVGLAVNVFVLLSLHRSHDVNIRSAFLHALGDTLSSVAVIIAAVWISLTGQTIVDPILGILIAFVIVATSIPLFRDTIRILLEFTPGDINLNDVIAEVSSVEGVKGVHYVHFWSLCSNINIFDAHIYTTERDMTKIEYMKTEIRQRLKKYHVRHSTLEFECEECTDASLLRNLSEH